jgi:hypothetical protein
LVEQLRLDPNALDTATLEKLITDTPSLATSVAIVPEDATLADARALMDALPKCQDVFVTAGGKKDGVVRGWVTNVIIQQNSEI